MDVESARQYFEILGRHAREPRLQGVVGACEFDVDGEGTWTVHVDRGALRVTEGPDPSATTRMRFAGPEFVRLARGEGHENIITAALRGEVLEFRGDVGFAQSIQALLPLPDEWRVES